MITEQGLREKLRKISALFEGAKTTGERSAAAAALLIAGRGACSQPCAAAMVWNPIATCASVTRRSW